MSDVEHKRRMQELVAMIERWRVEDERSGEVEEPPCPPRVGFGAGEGETFALCKRLRVERDEARARCRRAAQTLIEEVGADGPMSVEAVAKRAVAALRQLRAERDEARVGVARVTAMLDTAEHHAAAQYLDLYSIRGDYAAAIAEVARLRAEHEAPGEFWYLFDPFDGCHKVFRTAVAAKADAEACIEYGRNQDHWPDETKCIEWGRLIPYERATQTDYVAAEDDKSGRCKRDGLSHLCNYELVNVRAGSEGA